jgi:hypothetical protein
MQEADEKGTEAFFLYENSLKMLCKYLKKLSNWYNDVIYMFYFQMLHLYYWYDLDQPSQELAATFPEFQAEGISVAQRLYSKDFKLSPLYDDLI